MYKEVGCALLAKDTDTKDSGDSVGHHPATVTTYSDMEEAKTIKVDHNIKYKFRVNMHRYIKL